MSLTDFAERLYPKLPIAAQNVVCSLYGLNALRTRRGTFFRKKLNELLRSELWSRDQIDAYQEAQLQYIVTRAYEHVPHYRKLMQKLGITPADIRSRQDLSKLPLLSKEQVRENFEQLLADDADRHQLRLQHTSGTTGKSLHFYWAPHQAEFLWAVWWRHRMRFGLRVEDWHANFTGKLVVPAEQNEPPYWRWSLPQRQWVLNMHHVTPSKIADIVDFLNRHDAVYFSGYPSILHALAALGLEQGLTLQRRPRYVVTGAESLLEHQRTAIETFTGARITDQYGFSEACGNAAACPAGAYHEDFELGLIECVDPVTLPDGNVAGKIVCTGFANPWFPFIRYEVGDQGVWAPDDYQCPCGRKSRVLMRIEGRLEDYVLTPEGRRIARFDYVFKDTERVREVQVVQERLGEVILKVVRRSGYSATDEDFIRREMQRWISPALATKFDYVEHIPRTEAGKFRAVHSLLLPQNERHADAP